MRLPSFLKRSLISLLRWQLDPPAKMPVPDLALRVGFTGPLHFDDPVNLTRTSRTVLSQLRDALRKHRSAYSAALGVSGDVPVKLHLVSSLAAGADQVVARAALAEGYQLQAILPTTRQAFARDIHRNCGARRGAPALEVEQAGLHAEAEYLGLLAEARHILEISDVDPPTMDEYREAASSVLAHADILLAVMDEKVLSGVTVLLVRQALEHGIPVIWIPLDFTLAVELWRGDRRERLTAAAEHLVASIVLPGNREETKPGTLKQFAEWFEEGYQRSLQRSYNEAEWERSWIPASRLRTDSPPFEESRQAVERVFRPLAVWADYRSACFAGLYRGAFSLNALLGVIAVFLALFGLIIPELSWEAKLLELLLLGLMSGVFTLAHHRNWREKWLTCRTLYQQTHHQAWRFLMGETSPRRYDLDIINTARRGQVGFLLGALARSAGVPSGDCSDVYLRALRHFALTGLVRRQHRYFASESRSHLHGYHRIERWIARCVHLAMGITFLFLLLELAAYFAEGLHPGVKALTPFAIFAGAFFPACAASLVAVANFEEHGQLARRYAEMKIILRRVSQAMTSLKSPPGKSPFDPHVLTRQNFNRLLEATIKTADEELVHWQLILATKDLERL